MRLVLAGSTKAVVLCQYGSADGCERHISNSSGRLHVVGSYVIPFVWDGVQEHHALNIIRKGDLVRFQALQVGEQLRNILCRIQSAYLGPDSCLEVLVDRRHTSTSKSRLEGGPG